MADSKDTYRTVTPYLVVPDADARLLPEGGLRRHEANCQQEPGQHGDARRSQDWRFARHARSGGRTQETSDCGALPLGGETWTRPTRERLRRERRPKASPKTSRTDTERRGHRSRTASRGGLAPRSSSADEHHQHSRPSRGDSIPRGGRRVARLRRVLLGRHGRARRNDPRRAGRQHRHFHSVAEGRAVRMGPARSAGSA